MKNIAVQNQEEQDADDALTATRKFVSSLLANGTHPQEITQTLVYAAVDLGLQMDAGNHLLPAVLLSICAASRDFHMTQEKFKTDTLDSEQVDTTNLAMH